MHHFYCPSCSYSQPNVGVCEQDTCPHQWEVLIACTCLDGHHGNSVAMEEPRDSNGNVLQDGDSVVLIKDLTLRGSSQKIKQGTKVSKIRLTANPEEVDCKIDGMAIVLRTEFLKKV